MYIHTYTYIHTIEYYSATEKRKFHHVLLKDILLNDISQREKQIMYGINSMRNLKENKSQFHRNRE